jgi:glycosyltransferase involved in cell wall biosynthesis
VKEERRCVVALVISNLEFGGAERQVVELANHLSAEEFDVHVVSLSAYVPLATHLKPGRATLHIVDKRFKFDAALIPRLAKLLRRIRADIVHGFLFDAEIASRMAGRLAHVPVIIGSERNADYFMPARKRILYRLTSFAMDVCIANSNSGADFNSRVFGLERSRYRVVYNGVDTARFRDRDKIAIRAKLGIPTDSFCVGVFGSFKPQKNHLLFFSAAGRLVESCPKATFLVVGDTLEGGRRNSVSYKARVIELVRQLGLEDRCRFLGNRDDVEELYCACDVTVLPSLHEGTPNVALESMASHVPVIATDVSDNRYVIPDGVAGFIVSLGDADSLASRMLELWAKPDERARMSRAARRRVEERFSMDRLANDTADVYRQMLMLKHTRERA